MGQRPAPDEPDQFFEVVSHRAAALMQANRDDDPLLVEHVRAAHRLALDLHRQAERERIHA